MGSGSSAGRIWMVVAIVFIVISLALSGYIIYGRITCEQPSNTTMTVEQVVKRYPVMFRTEEEQKQIESQLMQENAEANLIQAANIRDENLSSCNFNCTTYNQTEKARRKRSAAAELHVSEMVKMNETTSALNIRDVNTTLGKNLYRECCITQKYFISPEVCVLFNGESCMLAQFLKSNKRQYFPSQACRQAKNCTSCRCSQEPTFMTAVVVNKNYPNTSDEQYTLAAIRIPGCCKCYNNLPFT